MASQVHVLGAGLAGLSAAQDIARAGTKIKVIELEPHVGGLASSFDLGDGFIVDLGPHRFHSTNQDILSHMEDALEGNFHFRDRLSRIFMMKRFFDYPLKATNVLKNLPVSVLLKAMYDYIAVRIKDRFHPIPDSCFENYIVKRFGRTLYEAFFGTYTEKAWGIPCTQISADWASQRITLLNLWDTVKKTLFKPKNVPRTLVSRFRYPKTGGIVSIAQGYAKHIAEHGGEVLTGAEVIEIKRDGMTVTSIAYRRGDRVITEPVEQVLSTIPITLLVTLLKPEPPKEILDAARALRHKAIVFVYLKLNRDKVTDDHWVYLPEKHLTVHRISEFKNFSEHTCPPGKTLVCAEITCTYEDRLWQMDERGLIDIASKDLETVGLIKAAEVFGGNVRRVRYAYPIYDLTYRDNLEKIIRYVRAHTNMDTTGRQGLFRYNNMDHSIAMGMKIARTQIARQSGDDHARVATGSEYFG
ncbi:MAG: FAD-dependent oxidoreductase [Planctomycetota bacterium]